MGMTLLLVQFSMEKLQDYLKNPQHFENDLPELENSEVNSSCDLDKAWEAIHYLLTGSTIGGFLVTGKKRSDNNHPLTQAVYSDQFFDEKQDLGVGPASYLTSEQVKDINNFLQQLDESVLRDRYNPVAMTEIGIYPHFWNDNHFLLDYVVNSFRKFKAFYSEAASKNHSIASYVN